MATYGAKNQYWAKFATESADADPKNLPKYDTPKKLGELNKVTDQYNFVDGSLAGDDAIALYAKKFKDGSVKVSSVYISVADNAAIHGAAADSKNGMSNTGNDEPPYIGYGFVTTHRSRDKIYYQAIFFPKLKAYPEGKTYDTRGDNIAFSTDDLSFHMEQTLSGHYRIIKDFDTETEADAFIAGLFSGTATAPGSTEE